MVFYQGRNQQLALQKMRDRRGKRAIVPTARRQSDPGHGPAAASVSFRWESVLCLAFLGLGASHVIMFSVKFPLSRDPRLDLLSCFPLWVSGFPPVLVSRRKDVGQARKVSVKCKEPVPVLRVSHVCSHDRLLGGNFFLISPPRRRRKPGISGVFLPDGRSSYVMFS